MWTYFDCRVAGWHLANEHKHIVSKLVIRGLDEMLEKEMRPKSIYVDHHKTTRPLLAIETIPRNLWSMKSKSTVHTNGKTTVIVQYCYYCCYCSIVLCRSWHIQRWCDAFPTPPPPTAQTGQASDLKSDMLAYIALWSETAWFSVKT